MRIATTMALLFLTSVTGFTQKAVTDQTLLWYSYTTTVQFNSKWYYFNEFQERHFVRPFAQHQALYRGHIHRVIGQTGWDVSAGFAVFLHNSNDPSIESEPTVPELRPHVEAIQRQRFSRWNLEHRYRFEARFFHNTNDAETLLEKGYMFENYRARYRFQMTVPIVSLGDQSALKAKISDEIHINIGKNIGLNTFDQNRVYVLLNFELSPVLSFDAGYLNWFQQRANGRYFNRDILLFGVHHKIDLAK